MGPVMNRILVGIFLALLILYPIGIFVDIFYYGIIINIWLALFNLIPFYVLDGAKIFAWDRRIWASVFVLTIILFVFFGFF